ncbi:amidase [Stappia sp. BW2]|uniref:amidase n=1 Tax=Stappia sp. BW2 TaxID=2592622 RepID=UPI0011DE9A38|nr:amidase [Stappia sp. BW2]TYC69046.1 amidase [Stappia sp. BW2]
MINESAGTHALIRRLNLGGDGLSVAIKDCIDIAGEVTACGSAAVSSMPSDHADVVKSLLASGCKIIGKANMHELAFGVTGVNTVFGTPVNPNWPDRIPGGSSSGSAVAVAAGLCDFAVGTDTGGSVRQPAICCGVYGLKPTFGRISRKGCHPADSSLDCVGVFARTATALTQAMAGSDPTFKTDTCKSAPRLAWVTTDPDPSGDSFATLSRELPGLERIALDAFDDAFEAGMTIISYETAQAFGHLLDAEPPLGPDVKMRVAKAQSVTPADVRAAETDRTRFTDAVDAALTQCDALIMPALPTVPPTLEAASDPAQIIPLTRFLRPFNLSGHPSLVLPFAIVDGSLPMGLQIVGRKADDARLCAIAEWLADTFPMFRQEDRNQ